MGLPLRQLSVVAILLTTSVVTTNAQSDESFPIRRSPPYKEGDRWRSDITSIEESKGTARVRGVEQKVKEKQTTWVTAIITIKEVDDDGYPTQWTARISKFERAAAGKARKALLKAGEVVHCRRKGTEVVVMDEYDVPLPEPGNILREYVDLAWRIGDAPLEPRQPIKVGSEWKADLAGMRATMVANGPPQLRKHPEVASIKGSGKLIAVKDRAGVKCLDLNFKAQMEITEELETAGQYIQKSEQAVDERFLIPIDYSKGLLDRKTVTTALLKTLGKGDNPTLDVEQVTTTIERRKYLEFKGGGIRPWKAPSSASPLLDGLLVGLSFDESTFAGSGKALRVRSHGRIAKPLRVKSSGTTIGQVGEAMQFDGQDDHVNIEGGTQALRSGVEAVTIACWVQSDSPKLQFIFDVGFYGNTSVTLNFWEKEGKFHLGPKTGGVGLHYPIEPALWTHVAAVWDGKTQRVYLNGKLRAETTTAKKGKLDKQSIQDLHCVIGSQSKPDDRAGRFFVGQMDEFALWTRALEGPEIATVYEKGRQEQSLFAE